MTLMVTDGWGRVKDGFAALFRRHGDKQAMAAELEASRGQLLAAQAAGDAGAEADVLAEWRSRLRRLMEQDPEAISALAQLVERYAAEAAARPAVHNEIHHNTFEGTTLMHFGSGKQINTADGTGQ